MAVGAVLQQVLPLHRQLAAWLLAILLTVLFILLHIVLLKFCSKILLTMMPRIMLTILLTLLLQVGYKWEYLVYVSMLVGYSICMWNFNVGLYRSWCVMSFTCGHILGPLLLSPAITSLAY